MSTFYVPLVIILLLYWKIFMTARARLRRRIAQKANVNLKTSQQPHHPPTPPSGSEEQPLKSRGQNGGLKMAKQATLVTVESDGGGKVETCLANLENEGYEDNAKHDEEAVLEVDKINLNGTPASEEAKGNGEVTKESNGVNQPEEEKFVNRGCQTDNQRSVLRFGAKSGSKKASSGSNHEDVAQADSLNAKDLKKRHVSLEAKRERKAAKTLAIVTGAFIACWLPFFILALFMAVYSDWNWNQHLVSFFLWLGYFNSTLNPIIYTIFSPEFRTAFKRILCGKSHVQNHRPRHLQ